MVRPKSKKQIRHENLIEFLTQFSQFQSEDGKPSIFKVEKERTGTDLEQISVNDINKAVVVFTDVLNIMSGSAGNVDFYELLQAYLRKPEYRVKINALVKEALFSTGK